MSYLIPQPAGPSQSAASNGIDLPPVTQQPQPAAQGVDLPPVVAPTTGTDLPPSSDFQHEQQKYLDQRWYEEMGKSFGSPNTQLYKPDVIAQRKADAEKFLSNQEGVSNFSGNGGAGMFGGTTREFGNKNEVGQGEKNIVYVKNGIMSNDVTPEGWGAYARSTLPEDVKKKYDEKFLQEFKLSKALDTRRSVVMDAFKQAGGETQVQSSGAQTSVTLDRDINAVDAANKAAVAAGFPPLNADEKGQLINMRNGAAGATRKTDYFTDLAGDTAGTLARSGFSTAASPGEMLLAIGSKIEDKVNGPRALGESNWFSRRLAESQATQKNYADNFTPQLSDRTDFTNQAARSIAEAAPALMEMLATEGASGPKVLTRMAAMMQGGAQSAESTRAELTQYAKDHGMSDSDAESIGLQGAAIIGPIATAINYLPLHQIIDKNPEVRSIVTRMLASSITNGAANTAQNITEQLVNKGLVGKEFSVADLEKAIQSGLVVGAAQGALPVGGAHGEEQPTKETPPAVPAKVNEFKPSFLDEGNSLPVDKPLSQDPEFMQSLADQQKAIKESNDLLSQVNQAPGQEPLKGQLPNDFYGKGENPLVEKVKSMGRMIESGQVPEADRADLEQIHKNTGVDLVPVKSPGTEGYADPEHPGTILYDVRNPEKSVVGAVAHEITHTFSYDDPAATKALVAAMPDTYVKRLWNAYADRFRRAGVSEDVISAYKDRAHDQEVLAEAVRESVDGNGILKRALRGDAGLWSKFQDAVSRTLNRFTAKGRFINKLDETLRSHFELKKAPANESFEARGKRIADAYEALKHEPNSPEVSKSYDSFKQETLKQFKGLQDQGVKLEPWTGEGQPYKNSKEMMADARDNRHLFFFTGGEMPGDHPMGEKTGIKIGGQDVSYNDAFRAIHDFYGHAVTGAQFGPRGEEQAYQAHSKMFSDSARPAMATETRGQNSFVNYGPNGEHNRANPAATIYAPQKAGILPPEFHAREGNVLPGKDYYAVGHVGFKNKTDLWHLDDSGEIRTQPDNGQVHSNHMLEDYRGRIDHVKHDISIASGFNSSLSAERQVIRQLQDKFPGYKIHYNGELVGGEEGNFLPSDKERDKLPEINNIRYEAKGPSMTEKVKALINSVKDSPVKFKFTALDTLKKSVQNDTWAILKATEAAKTRGGGEVLPSSDPAVLFAVLRGAGEAHVEQRNTGMLDAKNQVIHDGPTKSPITTEWKLKPVIDVAQAHFGDKTGNSIDRAQRSIVDTLISQSTLERGENRVRTDQFKAMQNKIKQIIRSLPAGEKFSKMLEADSTDETNIEHNPQFADTIKQVKDEHRNTLKLIADAKQRLADMRAMNKAADKGPQPEGEAARRSSIPTADAIEKAQAKLDALHAMIDSEATGKPLKPSDVLTEKDLAGLRQKSLDRPLSGISREGDLNPTGHLDMKKASEFLAEVQKSPAWEHIQEGARRYRVWGDVTLQKLVDQGFISKDSANAIRKSNQFYANMQRVMDESNLGSVYEGSAKVHKFRGSNRLIDNPYVNQDVTTDRVLKASQENQARRAFVDLAGKYPDIASKVEKSGPDTIDVTRDGVVEHWKVDPALKDAFDSMTAYHPEFLGGVLNAFGRMKRWGVTKTPAFILRNFTRDFQDRLFKGQSGLKDIMHALDKEMITEMTTAGGSVQRARAGSARMDYHKELSARLKEMSSDKSTLLSLPSKVWAGYSHLNDVSENANRVAEYNAAKADAKRKGWSDYDASLYAASKSRGLMDFAVSGSLIRQINRVSYMAFLNGRIQGSTGDFAAARNKPGSVLMKGLLMGTVPALAAFAIASAQGKEEEYAALPIWRRMMFNNYYVGMGTVKWVSVPKVPLAALFAAPVEFGVEQHAGRKDALAKIAGQGVNVFSPVDDPSILPASFLLENLTNYSFYYNRSIIPEWERGLPIERRNTEGSSRLGQMLSQMSKSAGWQVDPRYIDNAISRQFGGTGQLAQSITNLGSGKPMDTIGTFLSRSTGFTAETPGASSPDIADVYSRATQYYDEGSPEIKQIAAFLKEGYTASDRQGQDAAFEKARALAREVRKSYDEDGAKLQEIGKFRSALDKVQADFKSQDTFEKRIEWQKANPDKVPVLRAGESFDKLYTRLLELRKLRLNPDLPAATEKMADTQIDRVYSVIVNLIAAQQ